jgi:hypothetical protein
MKKKLANVSPGTDGPSICSEVCKERSSIGGEDTLLREMTGHTVRTSLCTPNSGSCRGTVTSRRDVPPRYFSVRSQDCHKMNSSSSGLYTWKTTFYSFYVGDCCGKG